MFRKIPFSPNELEIIGTTPSVRKRPGVDYRNTPVTPRENIAAMFYEKKPFWMPTSREMFMAVNRVYGTHLGRGSGVDLLDVFGVQWEYVPSAGGSMVRPGVPLLDDVNRWREVIPLPDIDAWDWEGEARETKLDPRFSHEVSFVNGFWFERLISFMDFMGAAMALIDDEQIDAVKDLFQTMTDLGCRLVDKICTYYPLVDLINIHDDWGSQKAPFFSEEVARELFVPYMKQLTDHVHSWGRKCTLHSCGHTEDRVECYIDGGFDFWAPQTMNNVRELYERFGDRIIFAVWPEKFDPETTPEDEQRRIAREFVDTYCQPGKPAVLGQYGVWALTPAFSDELYEYSRKKYLEIN